MREGGVEPPRDCAHWILNPARLPIPPLSRVPVSRRRRPPCSARDLVRPGRVYRTGRAPARNRVSDAGSVRGLPRARSASRSTGVTQTLGLRVTAEWAIAIQAGELPAAVGPVVERFGQLLTAQVRGRAGDDRPRAHPASGDLGDRGLPLRPRRHRPPQRLRFRPRSPRRLPLRLNDFPRPGPDRSPAPPERAGSNGRGPSRRGGRSSAALTVSFRPSNSRSWKSRIAAATSVSLANWTNAKPRGRPVSRSAGR